MVSTQFALCPVALAGCYSKSKHVIQAKELSGRAASFISLFRLFSLAHGTLCRCRRREGAWSMSPPPQTPPARPPSERTPPPLPSYCFPGPLAGPLAGLLTGPSWSAASKGGARRAASRTALAVRTARRPATALAVRPRRGSHCGCRAGFARRRCAPRLRRQRARGRRLPRTRASRCIISSQHLRILRRTPRQILQIHP